MDRKFVIDEEIRLKNGTDLLNTKVYANTLKNIITNIPNDKPFTIGLYGMWGSGKSSIIKTVKEELSETNKSYLFATFDAWKYTGDAFRRSFILSIASQA